MTYTFKLARRIARLRAVAFFSLALAGCSAESSLESSSPLSDSISRLSGGKKFSINDVRVSPDSLTVEVGQSAQMAGYGRTTRGDSVPLTLRWSATGGSITTAGAFSSAQAGRYRVMGMYLARRVLVDTALVVVVEPQSSVVKVLVTPDTAVVDPGTSRAFTAKGELSDSTLTTIGVRWSATGGTIDGAGNYKAGMAPGKFRVIAANTAQTLADTSVVTVPAPTEPVPPTLARVVLTPANASVSTGAVQQFAAYGRNSAGDSVATPVTFTATGGTITSSGQYTAGSTAGGFRVIAVAQGATLADTAAVTVTAPSTPPPPPPPPSGPHNGHFVATNGSSGGDGSEGRPWDLATALNQPSGVTAGDTIWLRGGTYRGSFNSRLQGAAGSPIIVRQYPGERAKVDGNFFIGGGYTWFWGFEVLNSDLGSRDVQGFNVQGPGTKLINLVVHDASGVGIGIWAEAPDAEVYGNVVYNNGRAGAAAGRYGHGIYFQNSAGTKLIQHNIVFNSYAYNFHGYAQSTGLSNITIDGNISFNAGSYVDYGGDEYLVGGLVPIQNLRMNGNFGYRAGSHARNDIGYSEANSASGSQFTNNYFTGYTRFKYWTRGLTVTGNTFVTDEFPDILLVPSSGTSYGAFNWDRNSYYFKSDGVNVPFLITNSSTDGYDFAGWRSRTGFDAGGSYQASLPTSNKVAVLPNRYERGRANVVVYNWTGAGSASVDLSNVLTPGDRYEVRNVQRYFDPPVASGTYGGGTVSLPLQAVTPVSPLGGGQYAAPNTGSQFQAFVVLKL